jgi:hypothetical protein
MLAIASIAVYFGSIAKTDVPVALVSLLGLLGMVVSFVPDIRFRRTYLHRGERSAAVKDTTCAAQGVTSCNPTFLTNHCASTTSVVEGVMVEGSSLMLTIFHS